MINDYCYNDMLRKCRQRLPHELQMEIMKFKPQLPNMPRLFWKMIHTHYRTRLCSQCGEFLERRHKRVICLCHRLRQKSPQDFFSKHSRTNVSRFIHVRPLQPVSSHTMTLSEFDVYMTDVGNYIPSISDDHTKPFVFNIFGIEHQEMFKPVRQADYLYVYSRQPVYLFSFRFLCRMSTWYRSDLESILRHVRSPRLNYYTGTVPYVTQIVNTHSCPRSFLDCFQHITSAQRRTSFVPSLYVHTWNTMNRTVSRHYGILSSSELRYLQSLYPHLSQCSPHQVAWHFFKFMNEKSSTIDTFHPYHRLSFVHRLSHVKRK